MDLLLRIDGIWPLVIGVVAILMAAFGPLKAEKGLPFRNNMMVAMSLAFIAAVVSVSREGDISKRIIFTTLTVSPLLLVGVSWLIAEVTAKKIEKMSNN